MFHNTDADARQIEVISEMILMRGLGVLAKHDELTLSDLASEVIDAYSSNPLTESFNE